MHVGPRRCLISVARASLWRERKGEEGDILVIILVLVEAKCCIFTANETIALGEKVVWPLGARVNLTVARSLSFIK